MPELEPDSENFYTARYLLILLSVSCPVIIGQRILNMIYSIRVEDYKLQRISAVGSILKILSVFFFFGSENYLFCIRAVYQPIRSIDGSFSGPKVSIFICGIS